MTHWYHIETTLRDGTTWRTFQPIPSLASVAEWIATTANAYGQDVMRIEIVRHEDRAD